MEKQIELYKSADNSIELQVNLDNDTVWLNRHQLSVLFERDIKTIGKHINNVFKDNELDSEVVVAKFATTTQHGAIKGKTQTANVEHYNLDVIISVGYRIKSQRGIQFRQWATQRLKEHLVQGYTINKNRLEQLQQTVELIQKTAANETTLNEAKGLLDIIANYTNSFVLLNQYDSNSIEINRLNEAITYEIKYQEAKEAITELKKQLINKQEASELFGNEKDKSFAGILQCIIQTFDCNYLYPSIEQQAAHLLYFCIKSHPFTDGNKRIGAFLFMWFLDKNNHRFRSNGAAKINDNGLTALALLVAQSQPEDKELMVKLIVSMIATN